MIDISINPKRLFNFLFLTFTLLPLGLSAAPIKDVRIFKTGGSALAVAIADGEMLFINKDLEAFRAFKWKLGGSKKVIQPSYYIRDINVDGEMEFVGVGKTVFFLNSQSDPQWSQKGCDQAFLADFDPNDGEEIFCRKGNKLTVFTWDNQFVWEYSLKGGKISDCKIGEVDGDGKQDVECKFKKKYLRINGSGVVLGKDFEEPMVTDDFSSNDHELEIQDILAGKTTFDIDGDGIDEEYLMADDMGISILSKSRKSIGRVDTGKVFSAYVGDLNLDKHPEIIVGGASKIFIISHEGKLLKEIPFNPGKMKRKPKVEIVSVYGNNIENSDETALLEVIHSGQQTLDNCYKSKLKGDQFTRVGEALFNLYINDKGKVAKIEKIHSTLSDKKVEKCATKYFKKLTFSPAVGGEGSITLNLKFTHRDE